MDTPDNVYAAPQAPLVPEAEAPQRATLPPFYVVSITKLVLLSAATFGLYSLYWFWRHWKLHKRDRKFDIWPVPRAVFAVFFAHSLNQEIDYRLRRSGSRYAWSPGLWAMLYVVSAIAGNIISRVPDSILDPGPGFALIMLTVAGCTAAMANTQRAANQASGDPEATGNARLTVANWAWLVVGGLLWLLNLAGIALFLGDA